MKRILVVSPTGSGKTVMFASIIASAVERGKRVLVVVHLRELVDQTIDKLAAAGITNVNVMRGNDKRKSATAFVTVCSIQTLARRGEKPEVDIVICDEAHRSLGPSFAASVWGHYRCVILGFTATPCRTDERGLGERFEAMVIAATYSELIAAGHVADPLVIGPKQAPDMSRVHRTAGDWNKGEVEEVMKKLSGHIVPTWLAKAENRSTIVFSSGIDHSLDIVRRFIEAGVTAEHVSGDTPEQERADILARLRSGETRVVSNCAVLTEGFDCPSVRCVVIARPTMSVILHMQTSGRALRPGEIRPIIIDHAGNVGRHGMPHHDREWSLDGKAMRPVEKNPFRQCKGCFAYVPATAGACPECGFEEPKKEAALPVEEEIEMVEVTGPSDPEVNDFIDLIAKAKSYGYKPGWIGFQWKTKYGAWPPRKWDRELKSEYDNDKPWQDAVARQTKVREAWQARSNSKDTFSEP